MNEEDLYLSERGVVAAEQAFGRFKFRPKSEVSSLSDRKDSMTSHDFPEPLPLKGEAVRILRAGTDLEPWIIYLARQSAPENYQNDHKGLLKFCLNNAHWSVFEMADITFEVVTSRDISAQLIRHKSISVQEFSQRYANVQSFVYSNPRKQAEKARQSSTDDLSEDSVDYFHDLEDAVFGVSMDAYNKAIAAGVAKEQARRLLPIASVTKLAVKMSIRSLIHYIDVRTTEHAQEEHRYIANAMASLATPYLPIIAEIKGWKQMVAYNGIVSRNFK